MDNTLEIDWILQIRREEVKVCRVCSVSMSSGTADNPIWARYLFLSKQKEKFIGWKLISETPNKYLSDSQYLLFIIIIW